MLNHLGILEVYKVKKTQKIEENVLTVIEEVVHE